MAFAKHELLHDVRVLDASRVLAGPFCGQILGDLGADVIKIERPGKGDETRDWGPPFAGAFSAYYLSCNRNKRAVAIDLGSGRGRQLFYELVKKSDVLLENFRAASAAKLGADAATLLKVNPKLVVCSISGFGRTGPMSELPGYDFAIQAYSGLMSITGPQEGPPSKVGVAVTDVLTGIYASTAVLACLHARRESGHGYHIDLALLDCALAAQVNVAQAYLSTGQVPKRQGNAHLQIVPYQAFQTQDDWIVLAVGNDHQWQQFCVACGRDDLAKDERFKTNSSRVQQRDILIPMLQRLFPSKTSEAWQDLLRRHHVPCAPVWNYQQLFSTEQIAERGMKITVRDPAGTELDLIGSPFHISGEEKEEAICPPKLGQHTNEILSEVIGLTAEEIGALQSEGVVR